MRETSALFTYKTVCLLDYAVGWYLATTATPAIKQAESSWPGVQFKLLY